MKTLIKFYRWGQSLKWWHTLQWAVALIGSGLLALYDPILSVVVFIEVLILIAFAVYKGHKGILIGLLIGSLLFSTSPQYSRAQDAHEPNAVAQCNAVVIGTLVIAVGGFIIYKLVKFCKKAFPPASPPPPPPPTPAPTNAPPAAPSFSPQALTFHLSEPEQTSGVDISHLGWMDLTQTNNPVPFQDYIHLTLSSSTNMATWTNLYSIGIWMSSNSVETVIYDGAGNPTCTNWLAGNPYATCLTNALPFKVYDPTKPRQFFKSSQ